MESYGVRVQKSAFEVVLSSSAQHNLECDIVNFKVDFGDSVRIYKMHSHFDVIASDNTPAFKAMSVGFC